MIENSSSRCECCGSWGCSMLMLLGRICLSIIFILAGMGKISGPEETAAYMIAKGMSMTHFFLYAAAAVEIIGGLSLLLGFKTRWGSLLLLLFLIPTTFIFHNFWNVGPEASKIEMIGFLKNLAIFGGLLYTLSVGPGKISLDRFCRNCEKKGQ